MSRLYTDQVAVEAVGTADGLYPRTFLWRRSRYRVRSVLARWIEGAPWWRSLAYQQGVLQQGASGVRGENRRNAAERWVWRVEALSPVAQSGVYDLCCLFPDQVRDGVTGEPNAARVSRSWYLIRALD